MKKKLKPLFKYPGGKSGEYKYLKKLFPYFSTYIEPFLGGGAVYWNVDANNWIINDYSKELMNIYIYTKIQDEKFIGYLEEIGSVWNKKNNFCSIIEKKIQHLSDLDKEEIVLIESGIFDNIDKLPIYHEIFYKYLEDSVKRKIKSLLKVMKNDQINNWSINSLSILGSAVYTYFRFLYNHISLSEEPQLKTALYLFLREYAYAGMFRYNAMGYFNVPFGGNTYAKKNFYQRIDQIKDKAVVNKLNCTKLYTGDFSNVLVDKPDTFIFLDPPYDTEFSTYNLHVFDANEQIRLRDNLLKLKKSRWLMVVKSTKFIEELYNIKGLHKFHFDKNYSVNIKNRNSQETVHLVITNYEVEEKKWQQLKMI
ncbi:DNA adenine methylase [Lactobacillus taiwanensis]|uniref:DNA adenine methylase n=1 Tax=Lactobacillus taiwanensis TaxID=508451 RepID=UPI00214C0383|nr:DNA adenine methylase [Lactobacillus taiwanensis]